LTVQAIPFILLQGFFFGTSLIASRFSVGQFHPTTYLGLRTVLASLCHTAVYLLDRHRRWPTDRHLWRHAVLLGIVGTAVPMTAIITAMQYLSAGLASVLSTAGPAITVLMAHFFLADETLTARKSAGVALALGGALSLALRGETGLPDISQASPLGYGLILLTNVCASGMTIYARKFMVNFDAFDVASARILVAALTVMPLSALFVGLDLDGVNGQGYLALGYATVVGTFLAFSLSFYNVKRFGATAGAMPLYVMPVVSSLGGALILDEQITGMGLIAAGIALINQQRRA
jgi:drug/metabolite transporter (DMT)-like permease